MLLLPLIVLYLLATTVILLAMPIRRLTLRAAWLAILLVIYMLFPAMPERSTYNEIGLAQFFTLALLISLAAATIINLISRAIARRSVLPAPDDEIGASDPPLLPLDGAVITTGALAGLTLVYAAFILGASIRPAWGALALIIGVSAGMLAFWPLAIWFGATMSVRQFAASLGWSAAMVGIGAVLWILHSIDNVTVRAEAVAGDKPYCIQVQGRHAYQPAASRMDFSPQTMRTVCGQGMCFDHHAVLVIADGTTTSLSHWSYRIGDFVPGVVNSNPQVRAVCQPKPHFARDLLLF